MQRGEARNSARVLSRLVGNRAMFVFLHDSVGVLSRPAGSGATQEMKNYTLKNLNLQATLPFPTWNIAILLNLMLCSFEKVYRGPRLFMG